MDSSAPTASFRISNRQLRRMSNRITEGNRGLVKLDFSHLPLYGRFQEKLSMVNSFSRVGIAGASGEVLLLYGKSGTGKTALVTEALNDFQDAHFRGRGKFEPVGQSNRPFAAIVAVFAELIESMIHQMGKDGEDYASAVSDALGDEAYRITNLIPELIDLIGERPANHDQQEAACEYSTFKRLLNLLRYMLRAICSFQKAVVLWFDDLHLADPDSLALIKYISNDPEAKNLLIIGSFEDQSRDAMEQVSNLLGAIDQVKTTLIRLDNLTQPSINSMINDVMAMDTDHTKKLARAVYKRTRGNAFLVIQFLELIQELGLLQFDVKTKMWVWDVKTIKETTSILEKVGRSSGKAKYAVSGRLSHLPDTSKLVLATAASLGSCNFDLKVMAWLLKDKNLTVEEAPARGDSRSLEKATSFLSAMMSSFRGFECHVDPENEIRETLDALEKIGIVERLSKNEYRFSHDMFQEGAYILVADESIRIAKHWKTGQYLKQLLDKRILEDDRLFFTMIDQLNRGSASVTDDEERLELSSLNLRAAYKAKERSAFTYAANYAYCGAAYLGDKKWDLYHGLAMKLELLAAEMALSSGDNESCMDATNEAIENGHTLDEVIPAYILRIKGLSNQGRHEEAIQCAFGVLAQLGEKFAPKPRVANLVMSISQLRNLMKGKSDELLLTTPLIEDSTILTTMQLLALTIRCASAPSVKDRIPLLRCRMLHLILKNGRCEEGALAYTGFGILLATTSKQCDDAFRFGNLGLQQQQLLNCPKYDARVAFEFYCFTHHIKQPIRHSLGPLHQSYKKGIRYGAIEDALMAAGVHCWHYFCSGRPLLQLSCILNECLSLAEEYTPTLYLSMMAYGQLVQNLIGKAPNSSTLNGDIMDLSETMHKIMINNDTAALRMVMSAQVELAVWFRQYAVAQKYLNEIAKLPQDADFNSTFIARRLVFYDGLVTARLVGTLDKPVSHLRNTKACAKNLLKYARQGSIDCLELSEILDAELLSLTPNVNSVEVTRAYQKAITSAVNSGAHQNVALANELAGWYQNSNNDKTIASLFLQQAHLSYTEWNAIEMAQRLVNEFPELESAIESSFDPEGVARTTDLGTNHNGNNIKVSAGRPHAGISVHSGAESYDTTLTAATTDTVEPVIVRV